jgi:hypothetical protein
MRVARKGLLAAASLAPGALVVVLAFQGGGFFPLSWTVLATVEAVALALLLVLSPRPLAGLGAAASVAVAALALLGGWMLVSASWSGAPGRALLDFDRLLAYLGLLVLTAALPGGPRRAAWTLRGVAAGLAVVCACALVTRLAPDVWSVDPGPVGDRLAYPVSYWNGLGLMAAAGLVLALHLTASTAEPRWVRVLAAALPAPLACTLYLTFSRGAIGAAVVGVVAYLLLGRPRGLPAALLSAGAATAICVAHAYGATALSTAGTPRADAIAAGHGLGWLLVACCAGAMGVRAALLPLDAALARLRPRPAAGARRAVAALLAASAVAVLVVAVAAGAPAVAERGVQRFLHAPTRSEPDLRGRLLVVSNNGRTDHWRVALDGFERHPWRGTGSGTFATEWNRLRSLSFHVRNAHSLVFETLGELGLVGLGLLALAFGAILAGLARRLRGRAHVARARRGRLGLAARRGQRLGLRARRRRAGRPGPRRGGRAARGSRANAAAAARARRARAGARAGAHGAVAARARARRRRLRPRRLRRDRRRGARLDRGRGPAGRAVGAAGLLRRPRGAGRARAAGDPQRGRPRSRGLAVRLRGGPRPRLATARPPAGGHPRAGARPARRGRPCARPGLPDRPTGALGAPRATPAPARGGARLSGWAAGPRVRSERIG